MEKIFHVFVSSTYTDLVEARRKVSDAVAKAGYVAEGMEIFPASSQKQMDFIHKVIDRCDYYVLVVAGRYGSVDACGLSYTELEYRYAVSQGIPVLAFLFSKLEDLDSNAMESDPELASKLQTFRTKVSDAALVDFWSSSDELATKTLAALSQARQSHPGVGWLRANHAASEELLAEINDLRKINEKMRVQLIEMSPTGTVQIPNLATLEDLFTVNFKHKIPSRSYSNDATVSISWKDLFKIIGTNFRTAHNTSALQFPLERYIKKNHSDVSNSSTITIDVHDKDTILIQMEALNLMKAAAYNLKTGGAGVFHKLTPSGEKLLIELNAIRRSSSGD